MFQRDNMGRIILNEKIINNVNTIKKQIQLDKEKINLILETVINIHNPDNTSSWTLSEDGTQLIEDRNKELDNSVS